MKCRACKNDLNISFVKLGTSPPSNSYLIKENLKTPEKWFPLSVNVCSNCWLAQTEDFNEADELFDENYAYFSSFSSSWLKHAEKFSNYAIKKFNLNSNSKVIEIAANDGYLLQYFKNKKVPCLGIEPTKSTANAAREKGIEILEEFFSVKLARKLSNEGKHSDLMIANNVLAHVPDINDFVSGFEELLNPQGIASFEFPHLMNLVKFNQFDTIYHEHFSYLSLSAVNIIFSNNGLQIFDVEEISTHGGSLRIFAQKKKTGIYKTNENFNKLLNLEEKLGMTNKAFYEGFQNKVDKIKNDFLSLLIKIKSQNKTVIGYGAAAKGNTIINYSGVKEDLIKFIVDKNPNKQNKFMPGSRIPILPEASIKELKPDFIIIFPWNLKKEIEAQLSYTKEWGCQFITLIPKVNL